MQLQHTCSFSLFSKSHTSASCRATTVIKTYQQTLARLKQILTCGVHMHAWAHTHRNTSGNVLWTQWNNPFFWEWECVCFKVWPILIWKLKNKMYRNLAIAVFTHNMWMPTYTLWLLQKHIQENIPTVVLVPQCSTISVYWGLSHLFKASMIFINKDSYHTFYYSSISCKLCCSLM
jgi:hypothetical protein